MATIRRYRVLWGGIGGTPGYSLFYANAAGALASDLVTFFNAIKSQCPGPLQWDVPISGDTLDDATGTINGGWTDVGGGVVTATGSGSYAAGTGVFIRWATGAIVNGRRLVGRTFICPINGGGYDSNGTAGGTTLSTIGGAATTLAAAGKLVVWHRPAPGGGGGGSSSLVTAGTVPDQVTSLRSRRV